MSTSTNSPGLERLRVVLLEAMKIDIKRFFYESYLSKADMGRKRIRRTLAATEDHAADTEVAQEVIDRVYRFGFVFNSVEAVDKVRRLQAWYRKYRQYLCTNNTDASLQPERGWDVLMRRRGVPVSCPVSLAGISTDHCVKLVNANGTVEAYDVKVLAEYLLNTRKFESPTNRSPILRHMVSRVITPRAQAAGVRGAHTLPGVYDTRNSFMASANERTDQLLGLERTCVDVFSHAVGLCEGTTGNPLETLQRLEVDVLPMWRDYVQSYVSLDATACLVMLRVEETRVQRLISQRHDSTGYMPYLLAQLREHVNACLQHTGRRPGGPHSQYRTTHRLQMAAEMLALTTRNDLQSLTGPFGSTPVGHTGPRARFPLRPRRHRRSAVFALPELSPVASDRSGTALA
jgi:hypothetical protein